MSGFLLQCIVGCIFYSVGLIIPRKSACIVESENLGCYPKIAKFGAIFPLKRQYKNLVGLTKDNHTIWSLHKDESTNKTVLNN
jgi:hypothetical protein